MICWRATEPAGERAVCTTGGADTNCAQTNYFLVVVRVTDSQRRPRPAS